MIGHWGEWYWGMGFGWFLAILFWAFVLLGVVALARWLFSGSGWSHAPDRPLDILRQRYARGELTREQYEQMRRDIES